MKKHNIVKKVINILLICLVVLPLSLTNANAIEYEVVFKAGAYGTVNNEKSVIHKVKAGSVFPNEPTVTANDGYVFSGWNKELPAVGSKVEGKTVYVAQYDVVIEGISYIVRYVDTEGIAIATSKTIMGESGSTITERAKVIPGYTYQLGQQEFKLSQTNKEIIFTYTLTNPEERIEYVEERVDVIVPTPNNQGNQNTANPGTNIEDNQVPQGNGDNKDETIENNEIPLANAKNNSLNPVLLFGIAGLVIVIILIGVLVTQKRKKD